MRAMNPMPTTVRTVIFAALALLSCACSSPRRPSRVPQAVPDASASNVPVRDLSVEGAQGVSGELIESHAASRFVLGVESLDEDDWGPVAEHLFLGFETSFETEGDWVGGEFGMTLAMAEDEESVNDSQLGVGSFDVDYDVVEASFGVHRSFLRETPFRPYVGAGLAVLYYDVKQQVRAAGNPTVEDDESDFTFGVYLHGGLAMQLGENFQIGLDLRTLVGSDTDGLLSSGDLDYQRVALFIGVGD